MDFLFNNFDILFGSPKSIKKLRALILSLAISGKLVPQCENDKPGIKLLEDIKAAKEQLIAAGKIKTRESLPPININEVPYALPPGWVWCYLDDICSLITDGTHHTPLYTDSGIPFLSVKDLSSEYLDFTDTKYISIEEHKELTKRCKPEKDDVLFTKVGTTGIAVSVNTNTEFSLFVSVALIKLIKPYILTEFITHLLNSPLVRDYSEKGTEGVGNKNLVLRKIKAFIIPLPPLAEQKRIVTKIEKLIALCNNLEMKSVELEHKRLNIHSSIVDSLLSAIDKPNYFKIWSLITKNFDEIHSVPQNVAALKKAILQLAVRGKLVQQSLNDQPAINLVKDIKTEKKQLFNVGKIKNQKLLRVLKLDEASYKLPKGWVWLRVIDCYYSFGNKQNQVKTKDYQPSGKIPIISQGKAFIAGYSDFCDKKIFLDHPVIIFGDHTKNLKYVDFDFIIGSDGVKILCPYTPIFPLYFYYVLKSYNLTDRGYARHFSVLNTQLFPLPPFAEQKRIVEKIEQLFASCDQLEHKISALNNKQNEILNAVLAKI
ncbi:MAG: restriction endonuclease subunit S [bacterium]